MDTLVVLTLKAQKVDGCDPVPETIDESFQ